MSHKMKVFQSGHCAPYRLGLTVACADKPLSWKTCKRLIVNVTIEPGGFGQTSPTWTKPVDHESYWPAWPFMMKVATAFTT